VAHGRYGGRELAVETPRERGDRGEPHRGRWWAAWEWGKAGEELNSGGSTHLTRGDYGHGRAELNRARRCGKNGRGGGTFYRASEGAEQMEWRRSPAVSAPSRRWFSNVKRGEEEWTRH
jgi:hypothetical protein